VGGGRRKAAACPLRRARWHVCPAMTLLGTQFPAYNRPPWPACARPHNRTAAANMAGRSPLLRGGTPLRVPEQEEDDVALPGHDDELGDAPAARSGAAYKRLISMQCSLFRMFHGARAFASKQARLQDCRGRLTVPLCPHSQLLGKLTLETELLRRCQHVASPGGQGRLGFCVRHPACRQRGRWRECRGEHAL
jgi:hypothetical protein